MKKGILLISATVMTLTAGATDLQHTCASQFFGATTGQQLKPLQAAADLLAPATRDIRRAPAVRTAERSPLLPVRQAVALAPDGKKGRLDSIIGYDQADKLYTRQVFRFDEEGRLVARQNAFHYPASGWETVEEYAYEWSKDGNILSEYCIGYGSGMKYDYKYDDRGFGIEKLTSYYDDATETWIAQEKGEYQYDDEGNITDELLSMVIDGEWTPLTHSIATYTTLHRQASFEGYSWDGIEWIGYAKENYEYFRDYSTHLTTIERFLWIPETRTFRNADVIRQDFNDAALCTLQERLFWNADREDWSGVYPSWNTDICYNLHSTLEYDARNRMTADTSYNDFEGDGEWTKTGDQLYTYTDLDNGNYSMEMEGHLYMVVPGQVYNDQCRHALFDSEGRKLWMLQQVRPSINAEMINDYDEKYIYNEFGDITRFGTWNWDGYNRIPSNREISIYDANGDINEQHFYWGEEGFFQTVDNLVGEAGWTDADDEGWVNATHFLYEYRNGERVSKMGWIWDDGQWLANFGADVEYDFAVPMSEVIFPEGTDEPYKILQTANYTGMGGTEFEKTYNVYFYTRLNDSGVDTVSGADSVMSFDGRILRLTDEADIRVADMTGATIFIATGTEADLSDLASGVYAVTATTARATHSLKIVVR